MNDQRLTVLDLFSGIGGFSLGLERTGGFRTVAFCEIEPYCRAVLRKHWPDVPIHEDVRELTSDAVGPVDLICGGYPCQPFSHAGKRLGAEDDRHLWPEMCRLVAELRPAWFIGENVAGHISMGLDEVLADLEALDYACRPFVLPACAVDAPHRRDRIWIVAHAERAERRSGEPGGHDAYGEDAGRAEAASRAGASGENDGARPLANAGHDVHARELDPRRNRGAAAGSEDRDERQGRASHRERLRAESGASGAAVADPSRLLPGRQDERTIGERTRQGGQSIADPDTDSTGREEQRRSEPARAEQPAVERMGDVPDAGRRGSEGTRPGFGGRPESSRWLPEPDVGRVANGIPRRVDRLRALGNAVVPQIPEIIGRAILEAERNN